MLAVGVVVVIVVFSLTRLVNSCFRFFRRLPFRLHKCFFRVVCARAFGCGRGCARGCARGCVRARWQITPVPGGACGHAADGRGGSACPPARAPAARAAQEHRQLHIVSYLVWGNEKSSVLLYSWRVVQDHQTRLPLLGIFMVV